LNARRIGIAALLLCALSAPAIAQQWINYSAHPADRLFVARSETVFLSSASMTGYWVTHCGTMLSGAAILHKSLA